MKLLRLSMADPESNLALDEAILDLVDSGEGDFSILRLWEPSTPFVVVGRASQVASEVNLDRCRQLEIPILRRCSGGAAVVAMPGCLMYAVVMGLGVQPELRSIDAAHAFVLGQMKRALNLLRISAEIQGISDLAINGRKVSGNSLRCKRNAILYHGTLLCRGSLELITDCLLSPPRQPDYRRKRAHHDFVTNLNLDPIQVSDAILSVWQPAGEWLDVPLSSVTRLVSEKYSQQNWHRRH